MPTARDLIARASGELARAGVPTPRVDAELLLAHVTGRPRLTLGLLREVPHDQAAAFEALVARRAAREPLQHLVGSAPFRHLELAVGPGVFVPRPETELLVDAVLRHLADRTPARAGAGASGRRPGEADPQAARDASGMTAAARGPVLVDLCSGSGALALSLAVEAPGSMVLAVEVCDEALAWTRRNVESCSGAVRAAGSALRLLAGDATTVAEAGGVLAGLAGAVDVVVTNPPYVPDGAVPRDPEVRDHDPHLALYGGPDGLDVIRPLARQAALLLRPGGLLLIEHADAQGEDAGPFGVPGLLRSLPDPLHPFPRARVQEPGGPVPGGPVPDGAAAAPPAWREVTDHADLNGLPRYTSAVRAGQDRSQ